MKKLEDAWVLTEKEKPRLKLHYELMKLKDHKDNIRMGWWTGCSWDGVKIDELKDIKWWKKANVHATEY